MTKLQNSGRPMVLVLGAAALFGTTGTALAQSPVGFDPISAGVVRLLVGGLGLVVIGRSHIRALADHRPVVLLGGIFVGVYQLGFFYSTRHAGVAVATVITIGSSPIFARVVGRLRKRKALNVWWNVAAVILLLGLALLSFSNTEGSSGSGGSIEFLGILAALAAGASYALYTESAAILVGRNLDSTAVMGGLFFGAGLLTSPFLLFRPVDWIITSRGVFVLLYLGIVTLTLAYVAFGRALSSLIPTTVVMLTLLEPVVATFLAFVVLHEEVSTQGWLGMLLVLTGLPLIAVSARRATTVFS